MKCPVCLGTSLVQRGRDWVSCPNCQGKGTVPDPVRTSKIAIVGEAWGADEAQLGIPFVGASGRELNILLEEAGIDKKNCYLTNVFNLQPRPTNDIKNLCVPKSQSTVPMPSLGKDLYLDDKYWPEVLRVRQEIFDLKPNLVICLGNTALWAFTGNTGISKLRGTVTAATYAPVGTKLLPTYHPSYLLHGGWHHRAVVVADLMKAERQSHFPEIHRPKRELWLSPNLNHIRLFYEQYVKKSTKMTVDIETAGASQITCVGFAPSKDRAIVIPFVDNRKPNGSYWETLEEEILAWKLCEKYLHHDDNPDLELCGQNTLYDFNWLWNKVGITPKNYTRDTMLKHHAWNPELEKGLGFLGSVYTDEPAWKTMRGKGMFTIKKGE